MLIYLIEFSLVEYRIALVIGMLETWNVQESLSDLPNQTYSVERGGKENLVRIVWRPIKRMLTLKQTTDSSDVSEGAWSKTFKFELQSLFIWMTSEIERRPILHSPGVSERISLTKRTYLCSGPRVARILDGSSTSFLTSGVIRFRLGLTGSKSTS